jgi:hypothetical protein
VRRHDAAHRLLLHVLELRQQHRLRLITAAIPTESARPANRRASVVQGAAARRQR